MTYTSEYPPAYSDTYVKATTKYSASYWPYYATDPSTSLIGSGLTAGRSWISVSGTNTNQRFHIDLGSAKVIQRIYYENYHSGGLTTNAGIKAFTMQGSNVATAFSTLTYATDTDWTNLTTGASEFDQHVAADQADPKYILVTNSTAYRYYALKISTNWGFTTYVAVRRIELQSSDGVVIGFIPGAIWF